jgi:hypothetical protein
VETNCPYFYFYEDTCRVQHHNYLTRYFINFFTGLYLFLIMSIQINLYISQLIFRILKLITRSSNPKYACLKLFLLSGLRIYEDSSQ